MEISYEGEKIRLTKADVLSLDIATHTGYHSIHGSGTWDFTEAKYRNNNKQHKDFRDTVMAFIKEHRIKQVVVEDVSAGTAKGGFKASVKLAEFRGILFEICDELNLPEPISINPKSVKKWATGDGKADKEKMFEFCIKRWAINPIDDNEADATHIFYYFCRKFNIV